MYRFLRNASIRLNGVTSRKIITLIPVGISYNLVSYWKIDCKKNQVFYVFIYKCFPFVWVNISLHCLLHCVLTNITLRHTVSCNCFNAYYRMLMVEAYGTLDQVMNYYGTPSAPGGHFPFNFRFITDVYYNPSSPSSAEDISRTINEYLDRVTDGRTANWVVCTCSVSRSVLFRREASWGH